MVVTSQEYPNDEQVGYYLNRLPLLDGREMLWRREKFSLTRVMRPDWTAKKCAIHAGYEPKAATTIASGLLKDERIRKRMAQYQAMDELPILEGK